MQNNKRTQLEFIDFAKVYLKAGKGGDGCMSFRREKYVPFGGPDGGNGGKGGDIYCQASLSINTLTEIAYHPHIRAKNGEHGKGKNLHGKHGKDTTLYVPCGTLIRKDNEIIADLKNDGDRILIALGGRGGRGNTSFKTRFNTAPRISEKGEPGQEFALILELSVLADVGLIGFPNAGKSTLLSKISSARPKIADYPFTTLNPNLGMVRHKGKDFVAADIPGLIEGAHEGKGLGDFFLKHIMRTKLLLHLVDPQGFKDIEAKSSIKIIAEELKKFNQELLKKSRIIVLNKSDLPCAQKVFDRIKKKFPKMEVFLISALTGSGINKLFDRVVLKLQKITEPKPYKISDKIQKQEIYKTIGEVRHGAMAPAEGFRVERGRDGIIEVHDKNLKRIIFMTNFSQIESIERLKKIFKTIGLDKALKRLNILENEIVRIEGTEFEWKN
jgi:GTP-binding protein